MKALNDTIRDLRVRIRDKKRQGAFVEAEKLFEKQPHSTEACKIVEEYLKDNPDDPCALHHIAVHWHSLAFACEAEGKPFESVFNHAMQKWCDLINCDAFWDKLWRRGSALCEDRFDPGRLDEVRAVLPKWLLEVHESAVKKHWRTDIKRARAHMNIILNSPFVTERGECRKAVFGDFFMNAQANLVDRNDTGRLRHAKTILESYLELDPDYDEANIELLYVTNELANNAFDDLVPKKVKPIVKTTKVNIERIEGKRSNPARAVLSKYYALKAFASLFCDVDTAGCSRALRKCFGFEKDYLMGKRVESHLQCFMDYISSGDKKIKQGNLNGYLDRCCAYREVTQYEKARSELNTVLRKLESLKNGPHHQEIKKDIRTVKELMREIDDEHKEMLRRSKDDV